MLNIKPKELQSDRREEYLFEWFFFGQYQGIKREFTQPYTLHQNKVSKHKNHTSLEKTKSMVFKAKTPSYCWVEIVCMSNSFTSCSLAHTNLA
jgi:hypothetical protein